MANTRKPSVLKKLVAGFLLFVLVCTFLGSYKGIYVNLQNMEAAKLHLYNPIPDLLVTALSSILLGFVLGYWVKSKR